MNKAAPIERQAGLLVRPLPSTAVTGAEPIRFGGCPRLPASLDWPERVPGEPLHFLAEIDFAGLPRKGGLPRMPKRGTAFVFMPLSDGGLYDEDQVVVLYTDQDVSSLPTRVPPARLLDLRQNESCHVHPDGLLEDGRCLVRQHAEVLPFASAHAVNPLALNMDDGADFDAGPWHTAHATQQQAIQAAFKNARALPRDPMLTSVPAYFDPIVSGLHANYTGHYDPFDGHLLDWEFIWDWSKEFYRLCYCLTLDLSRHIQDQDGPSARVDRLIRILKSERKAVNKCRFGEGDRPYVFQSRAPLSIEKPFDKQAHRWMRLAQFQTGLPNAKMLAAFCDMLNEVMSHKYKYRTDDAESTPRIAMIQDLFKLHNYHEGHTFGAAIDSFGYARARATERDSSAFETLDQISRWDSRIIKSGDSTYDEDFTMGIMPLQMFGFGFEIQSAVTDHADDILLFQIGDSFGLPIQGIGPDMVIQLWIKPEDLSAGRFDRVQTTADAS